MSQSHALRSDTLPLEDRHHALGAIALRTPTRELVRILKFGERITLGSGATADVSLREPGVSQLHVTLTHVGDAVEVVDLGSRNGTRADRALIERCRLTPPVRITLGSFPLSLEETEPSNRPAPVLPGLIGRAPPMIDLGLAVERLARLDLPVLLRGESGTGKELVARALHDLGGARQLTTKRPFVVLNAAALPKELAESELFGHVRGAFTGALFERKGAFVEAHRGTLFIDEIGALGLELQAKLLRVVEDGRVKPLGGERVVETKVRLIVATCEPLEEMVADGRFRADLYERLAVGVVRLPPLRERPSDLPELARHLLGELGFGGLRLSDEALRALRQHRFPGNVRELRNILARACVNAYGPILDADGIGAAIDARRGAAPLTRESAMARVAECQGNISLAARRLRIPRSTLRDLLNR